MGGDIAIRNRYDKSIDLHVNRHIFANIWYRLCTFSNKIITYLVSRFISDGKEIWNDIVTYKKIFYCIRFVKVINIQKLIMDDLIKIRKV